MSSAAEQQVKLDDLEVQLHKIRVRNIRIGTAFAEFLISLIVREAVRRLLD